MMKRRYVITLATILFTCICSFYIFGTQEYNSAKADQLNNLYRSVGYDADLDIFINPIREQSFLSLASTIDDVFYLQYTALNLMARAVERSDLSVEIIAGILNPSLERIFDGNKESLVLLANRVKWHIDVRSITDSDDRINYLNGVFDKRQKDIKYYTKTAIRYLIEIDSDILLNYLQGELEKAQKNRLFDEHPTRLKNAIAQVKIRQKLAEQTPSEAINYLKNHLLDMQSDKSFPGKDFNNWLVRNIILLIPKDANDVDALVQDININIRYRQIIQAHLSHHYEQERTLITE